MSNDPVRGLEIDNNSHEYYIIKYLLRSKMAIATACFVLGYVFSVVVHNDDRIMLETCKSSVKERSEYITKLLEENRRESLDREKSITAQRDIFIEMVRDHLTKMATYGPRAVDAFNLPRKTWGKTLGQEQTTP